MMMEDGTGKLGTRMKHFYVQMDASLMHTMNIPKKFAKIIEGSSSGSIKIEGPSNITWHVKMIRFNGTFSLRSGWNEFVAANKIDKHDALVFTYNGNSCFKVTIFDPSGCEKVASFFAKKKEIGSGKSTDSFMRVGAVHLHEVKKENISISSDSDTENSSEISSRTARVLKRKRRDFLHESTKSGKGCRRPVRQTEDQKSAKECSKKYMLPRFTYLTKDQENIANRMAQKTQKGSNLFVKILNSSNTSTNRNSILNLPSGFAREVLGSKNQNISLLPADLDKSKGCTAMFCYLKYVRRIGCGWRKFASKNGLKEGDLCLFELRKQKKRGKLLLTFVVHHFDRS